jgi:hypothetical protein
MPARKHFDFTKWHDFAGFIINLFRESSGTFGTDTQIIHGGVNEKAIPGIRVLKI